ncbi:MAG: exodeoxyribonuclease VII large subunit [Propionivibrio sp.]
MTEAPPSPANLATPAPVIPVSLLNRMARERLESAFPLCWVAGEISNLTYAASGHVYFTLKDAQAQVRCVMYRNRAQLLGWRLANGQRIEARVLVTLYEARGDFQLNVENARQAGTGNLYEEFLRRKARLDAEGLFAPEHKRDLPAFPRRIGLITSPQAAALRDVLTTLRRRAPQVGVVLYPTPVQGAGAAREIVAALRIAGERKECDLLILCRGGGSLEDLWEFNDEALARAIRACPLPVISGVGHETDFTLADFAADCRAPTPTAAAELAAPARDTLLDTLAAQRRQLQRQWQSALQGRQQALDLLALRLVHPAEQIARQRRQLDHLAHRLGGALAQICARRRQTLGALGQRLTVARPQTERAARRLDALAHRLDAAGHQALDERRANLARFAAALAHLNPQAVLERGYSLVTDEHGVIVRDSRTLEPNARIAVCFRHGRAEATVIATQDE